MAPTDQMLMPSGGDSQAAPQDVPGQAEAKWVSFRPFLRDILIPFGATRLMLLVIAWLSLQQIQTIPHSGAWEIGAGGQIVNVENRPLNTDNILVNAWGRWDSAWYYSVAKFGYHFVPGQQSNTAFFPLYPLLIRALHFVWPSETDRSWFFCGVLVSNIALLVALSYLYAATKEQIDEGTAQRAVLYMLVFPSTLYYSAIYTEGLFVACAIAALYYGQKGRWWLAGFIAAGASLTRSPGVVLGVPLAFEYMRQRRFRLTAIRWDVLAFLFIPLALAAFSYYLYVKTGNAFATRDAQFAWGLRSSEKMWPWNAFTSYFTKPIAIHGAPNSLIDLGVTLLFLAAALVSIIKLRAIYSIYACATWFFVTSWGSLGSMLRYVLVLFPCFVVFAVWGRNRIFHQVYLAVGTGLAAFFMILFVHWRWVG